MTLRERIAALVWEPPDELPADGGDALLGRIAVRNLAISDVLAVIDNHDKDRDRRLACLVPSEDITEERKLGYRLGVSDAIGVVTGRIKHIDWHAKENSECALCAAGVLVAHDPRDKKPAKRPAREALFGDLCPGMEKDYGPKYTSVEAVVGRAIIEAIDALAAAIRETLA